MRSGYSLGPLLIHSWKLLQNILKIISLSVSFHPRNCVKISCIIIELFNLDKYQTWSEHPDKIPLLINASQVKSRNWHNVDTTVYCLIWFTVRLIWLNIVFTGIITYVLCQRSEKLDKVWTFHSMIIFALLVPRQNLGQRLNFNHVQGGGPRVVVSTAAFHEFRVRFPVSAVWKKQKMFLPHPRVKVSFVGSLRDREVACSTSDRQGSNFESCVWRTVSSQSSHHPQEVLLAQFSLYVHKGGIKPDSFHFNHVPCKICQKWAFNFFE